MQYCHEKLSKKTMYPPSAAMEKAAKKLASKEENDSASFICAIVKVVRGNSVTFCSSCIHVHVQACAWSVSCSCQMEECSYPIPALG